MTMTIVLTGFLAQNVSADPNCKPIHAVQRDVLITENCPSPIGFCAAGTITGNHGLRGTTFYSSRGFHPVPGEEPTRQVVVGTSTFTTDDGVIIVEDLSVFDTVRGTFAGVAPITEGTGRFAGATGDILTVGRVLPDGSLITDVTGEICLPE